MVQTWGSRSESLASFPGLGRPTPGWTGCRRPWGGRAEPAAPAPPPGQTCEVDINECVKSPCRHGASCQNTNGSYRCHCQAGYTGRTCETDIDDCRPSEWPGRPGPRMCARLRFPRGHRAGSVSGSEVSPEGAAGQDGAPGRCWGGGSCSRSVTAGVWAKRGASGGSQEAPEQTARLQSRQPTWHLPARSQELLPAPGSRQHCHDPPCPPLRPVLLCPPRPMPQRWLLHGRRRRGLLQLPARLPGPLLRGGRERVRQQPLPQRRQLHGLRGQLHLHLPHGLQRDPLREQHARLHGEVGGPAYGRGALCVGAQNRGRGSRALARHRPGHTPLVGLSQTAFVVWRRAS